MEETAQKDVKNYRTVDAKVFVPVEFTKVNRTYVHAILSCRTDFVEANNLKLKLHNFHKNSKNCGRTVESLAV